MVRGALQSSHAFYVASQDKGTVVRKIQVVCEASLCSLNGAKTSEAGSRPADA